MGRNSGRKIMTNSTGVTPLVILVVAAAAAAAAVADDDDQYDEILMAIIEMMVMKMIVKVITMLKCIEGKWLRMTMIMAMMRRRGMSRKRRKRRKRREEEKQEKQEKQEEQEKEKEEKKEEEEEEEKEEGGNRYRVRQKRTMNNRCLSLPSQRAENSLTTLGNAPILFISDFD